MIRERTLSIFLSRLIKASFWSIISDFFSKGMLMLSMVFLARILDKHEFGEFGTVRSTINLFATFGGIGIGVAANRFLAKYRETQKENLRFIIFNSYKVSLILGGISCLALMISADYLARSFLNAPQLRTSFLFAGLLVLGGALNGAQIGILQGLGSYNRLAWCNLVNGFAIFLGLCVGASYYHVPGAYFGYLIGTIISIMVFQLQINIESQSQEIGKIIVPNSELYKEFLKFSIPILLTGMAVIPFKWFPEAHIASSQGFTDLGLFQAAFIIPTVIITGISALNAPMITLISGLSNNEYHKLKKLNLYISWYCYILLASPLIVFSEEIIQLLFGKRYSSGEINIYYITLTLYAGLLLYYQGVVRLLIRNNSMWFAFFTNLVEGVTLLVTFWWLRELHVIALCIAYLVSYIIRIAISLPAVLKEVSAPIFFDIYFCISGTLFFGLAFYILHGFL